MLLEFITHSFVICCLVGFQCRLLSLSSALAVFCSYCHLLSLSSSLPVFYSHCHLLPLSSTLSVVFSHCLLLPLPSVLTVICSLCLLLTVVRPCCRLLSLSPAHYAVYCTVIYNCHQLRMLSIFSYRFEFLCKIPLLSLEPISAPCFIDLSFGSDGGS